MLSLILSLCVKRLSVVRNSSSSVKIRINSRIRISRIRISSNRISRIRIRVVVSRIRMKVEIRINSCRISSRVRVVIRIRMVMVFWMMLSVLVRI